jgi:hypothetical protein
MYRSTIDLFEYRVPGLQRHRRLARRYRRFLPDSEGADSRWRSLSTDIGRLAQWRAMAEAMSFVTVGASR